MLALALSILCISTISIKASEASQTAGWYIDTYGLAPDTDMVRRVEDIYRKVKRHSENTPLDTRLVIVSRGSAAWAVALPDGNIVISADTISIVYNGVDLELGDARIAFILGHELAHQSNRDFWHQKLTLSGEGAELSKELRRNAGTREARYEVEIKADEVGFINAALAGYRTDRLVDENNPHKSFIEYWVNQTGTVSTRTHPAAADRSAILRSRLAALEHKVEFFKYGVRLAHFGRLDDALQFLIAAEREYPSREILNNLGYVYLQSARRDMPESMAYRFWYPTLLETGSGLGVSGDSRSWSVTSELSEGVLVKLEIAQEYLQRAVKLDRSDIVSRANLIAVNLYLNKPGAARDLVEEAAQIKPGDTQIMGLRALVLYHQEPGIDTWERARKILEPLSKLTKFEANIVYNYARLLQERGRAGAGSEQWSRLSQRLSELPANYQKSVCRELDATACEQISFGSDDSDTSAFWNLPLEHGDDVDSQQSDTDMQNWSKLQDKQVGTISTRLLVSPDSNSMLALDNKIELAVLKSHPFSSTEALVDKMGEPGIRYPLASGEIWSYGERWSALVDRGRVKEIWISQP